MAISDDTILIPENGRPLVTFRLEIGQALLYVPDGPLAADATVSPVPVALVRITAKSVMLRFPDGRTRRRQPWGGDLFFASWCPVCELPAHDDAGQLVCSRCKAPCAGFPPAHVFPATVKRDMLNVARRARLRVERGWTNKQAWERVHGPLRAPNRLGEGLRAWMAGDMEAWDRIGLEQRQWWDRVHAAIRLPLPPVSPFDRPILAGGEPPAVVRDADDSTPDGADDLTRWLEQQFDRVA